MKKWKCPGCGKLTDEIVGKIEGTFIMGTDGDAVLNEWETCTAYCDECGFEENLWGTELFEVVDE